MLEITPATPADLPALSALITSLFALEPDFAPNDAKQQAGLRMQLADPERSLVLKAVDPAAADAERGIVGMLTVQLVASTAEGAWSGLMEDVVVAATHRGLGVGRARVQRHPDGLPAKTGTQLSPASRGLQCSRGGRPVSLQLRTYSWAT